MNATLIGEKTIPKGCRVINVSQDGMLLHCDADGRLLTLKDGDTVDVHLTVLHEGKQKKLTLPSWVRQVAANSVDVEFHKPDPLLMELIEAYRVSEKHKLEASLDRMDKGSANARIASIINSTTGNAKSPGQQAKQPQRHNNRPFYTVILAIVFAVCVITGGYVYTASIDSRISTLETLTRRQSTELTEVQSRIFNASLQEGRYASLNARMTALSEAFVSLENRLGQIIPPPAGTSAQAPQANGRTSGARSNSAPATGPETIAATDKQPNPVRQENATRVAGVTPEESAGSPARPAAAAASQAAIARTGPPVTAAGETGTAAGARQQGKHGEAGPQTGEGPWIINLLSSRDKDYVERFSRNSGAAEKYQAAVNSAMVNGRQYWRLQLTGFESLAAAKRKAGTVKQELGINEVWFIKRK
jgi:SPOR domain